MARHGIMFLLSTLEMGGGQVLGHFGVCCKFEVGCRLTCRRGPKTPPNSHPDCSTSSEVQENLPPAHFKGSGQEYDAGSGWIYAVVIECGSPARVPASAPTQPPEHMLPSPLTHSSHMSTAHQHAKPFYGVGAEVPGTWLD